MSDEMIGSGNALLIYSSDDENSEVIGKINQYEVFSVVESEVDSSEWLYIAQAIDIHTKLKLEDYNKSKNGYIKEEPDINKELSSKKHLF